MFSPAYMECFSIISQQQAFPSILIHWFPSNFSTPRIMGSQVTGGTRVDPSWDEDYTLDLPPHPTQDSSHKCSFIISPDPKK